MNDRERQADHYRSILKNKKAKSKNTGNARLFNDFLRHRAEQKRLQSSVAHREQIESTVNSGTAEGN